MYKSYLIFICIIIFTTGFVQADERDKQYLLSKKTYDLLNVVQSVMEKEKYQLAIQKLNDYLGKNDVKAYDVAIINQTLGYAYNATENNKLSIESFVNAVAANALPDKVAHELNYIIAQLLMQSEKYTEGLNYLDKWFEKETKPSTEAHLIAATAYYQTDQFKKLIPHAKSAIEKSDAPQQSWYELLLAGYYETKMFNGAASLLETMINKYPDNNNYWLQLATVYQQNNQDKKGLALLSLAYEKDILDSNNIIQLVQTYLYLQQPLKAATILDKELRNGKIVSSKITVELLSNSWLLAHEPEQAAISLERYVSKFNDATLYYKLGHIYVELEDWAKAINALESAVSENELKDQRDIHANAWLLLGISSYHQKNRLRSTQALNMALEFKETKNQAAWWLDQIAEEPLKTSNSET